MKILRASTNIEAGTIQLRLNNQLMDTDNLYEEELDHGDYTIEWAVEGKPYSSFRITISSPVAAEFHLSRNLDATGKDSGSYRFSV
jgi:hypothetical protein